MDLSTHYLGLNLPHPVVPSASPMTSSLGNIEKLVEAGACAIVMSSLFEEQITGESELLDHYLSYGVDSYGEALSYLPEPRAVTHVSDRYLRLIEKARAEFDIKIIGSLNGSTPGGWTEWAAKIESAGADALELNMYTLPTESDLTSEYLENRYVEIVSEVTSKVSIPVAVKLSPFFTCLPHLARRLVEEGGAKGLVLFNRFYQPDFDLEELEVRPTLTLSDERTLRLPMTWIAILYGQIKADFALTGGVHSGQGIVKAILAGASIAQTASALLRCGPGRLRGLLEELKAWMEEHEIEKLSTIKGSMCRSHVGDPAAFERLNYMKVLHSWRPDPAGYAPL